MSKKELTREQKHILENKGTEPAFSHPYNKNKESGMYECAKCGNPLFPSDTKFDSGSGWPSFWDPASSKAVKLKPDNTLFMKRTEVICAKCGGHLGHVFPDGPKEKSGKRYCINGLALDFKKKKS